jgi:hypothetical protein
MQNMKCNLSGTIAATVAGALAVLLVAGSTPAAAQAPDAAERCTPDVMRLCSEFVPDADRIVRCLKVKRRQLSPSCASALQPKGGTKSGSKSGTKKGSKGKKKSTG